MAIRLWPNYEHALNNLGNILKSKGQYDEAEQCFLKALSISPKFAASHMNLGKIVTDVYVHTVFEI